MTNKLKQYFPLIQERSELEDKIKNSSELNLVYSKWSQERQKEFLDFCTGVRGVKILYDSFFKEVINPEYTPERLESLLEAILNRKVKIVHILPNDSTRIADESSLLITDIIVELEDGSLANIEIQKISYTFPGERSACYSADMLLRQYKRVRSVQGEEFSYNQIKNVYLIVIYENSPKEFKAYSSQYYHYGKQVFNTGLKLNMLQEYVMIPLDIFYKNMDNKSIETPLEAWLTFLSNDDPERIIELITTFPEFKPMYETLYQMCRNVERVINMFSEELRILDKNTVKYMIEEQQQEIDELQVNNIKLKEENENLQERNKKIVLNMLQADMTVEDIVELMECDISYVEEIKSGIK